MNNEVPMKEERSVGDLFAELANETGILIRQEIALAQAEMTAKVTRARAPRIGTDALPISPQPPGEQPLRRRRGYATPPPGSPAPAARPARR